MWHWKKKWMVLFLSVVFITTVVLPVSAEEQGWSKEPTAAAMAADFALVRPLGIVATVVGSVFFVVSLPFSAPGGNAKAAYEKLMADPARFTFSRPLGLVE